MLNKKFSGELRVQRRSHRPDGRGTLVQRLHVLLHLGDGGGDEVAVGVRDEVRHEPSHADVVDALADAGNKGKCAVGRCGGSGGSDRGVPHSLQ